MTTSLMPTAAPAARCGRGARSTSRSRPAARSRPRSRRTVRRTHPSARRRVACAAGSSARQRPSSRRVSDSARRANRIAVAATRERPRRAARCAARPPAGLRHVLAGVDDEPVEPGRELRLAPELADPLARASPATPGPHRAHPRVAQDVQRDALDAGGVPLAERRQRLPVSVLGAAHENRVRQPLVDERPVGPQITHDWTRAARWKVARAYSSADGASPPDLGRCPRCAASIGREYHSRRDRATTQRMLPAMPRTARSRSPSTRRGPRAAGTDLGRRGGPD